MRKVTELRLEECEVLRAVAEEGKETITIEMTETRTVRRTISVTKEELALIRTGELPVWVQECCLGDASGDEDYQVTFSMQEPEKGERDDQRA